MPRDAMDWKKVFDEQVAPRLAELDHDRVGARSRLVMRVLAVFAAIGGAAVLAPGALKTAALFIVAIPGTLLGKVLGKYSVYPFIMAWAGLIWGISRPIGTFARKRKAVLAGIILRHLGHPEIAYQERPRIGPRVVRHAFHLRRWIGGIQADALAGTVAGQPFRFIELRGRPLASHLMNRDDLNELAGWLFAFTLPDRGSDRVKTIAVVHLDGTVDLRWERPGVGAPPLPSRIDGLGALLRLAGTDYARLSLRPGVLYLAVHTKRDLMESVANSEERLTFDGFRQLAEELSAVVAAVVAIGAVTTPSAPR